MYTHTHVDGLNPKQQTGGLEWYGSQPASSVLCLGFDTNPHSMGAHFTTWGVRVFMYMRVCLYMCGFECPIHHLFVLILSQTSSTSKESAIGCLCACAHECFPCVGLRAQVLHASVWSILFSTWSCSSLINLGGGQLYESRLSSTPFTIKPHWASFLLQLT